MNHPTQQIINTLNLTPYVESNGYLSFDDGGVECSVGELLYSFIRILRPKRTIETGLYSGISLMYVAQALRDNGEGHAESLEYETLHIQRSKERIIKMDLQEWVTIIQADSREFQPQGVYDFIFLDTEPSYRFMELEKFYPHLAPGGYIGIHDLPPSFCQGNFNPDHPEMKSYPFGDVPPLMKELLQTGKLVKSHFPSPRGFVMFYRPKEEDYRA